MNRWIISAAMLLIALLIGGYTLFKRQATSLDDEVTAEDELNVEDFDLDDQTEFEPAALEAAPAGPSYFDNDDESLDDASFESDTTESGTDKGESTDPHAPDDSGRELTPVETIEDDEELGETVGTPAKN